MAARIYVNIPTKNVEAATKFYEAIGFVKNAQFSNEEASALSINESIYVMILAEKFFKSFIPHKEISDSTKTAEVINAMDTESRAEVDAFMEKALAAGGKEFKPAYDFGFMYGRDFEDLDGHIWEIFYMDEAAAAQQMGAQA